MLEHGIGYSCSEDDLTFILFHVVAITERYYQSYQKPGVVVVCHTGIGTCLLDTSEGRHASDPGNAYAGDVLYGLSKGSDIEGVCDPAGSVLRNADTLFYPAYA